jgi:hypothetical protein
MTRPIRRFRTATPVANGANRRHSAALSEFKTPFLNGQQRSVNRKAECDFDTLSGGVGWQKSKSPSGGTFVSVM